MAAPKGRAGRNWRSRQRSWEGFWTFLPILFYQLADTCFTLSRSSSSFHSDTSFTPSHFLKQKSLKIAAFHLWLQLRGWKVQSAETRRGTVVVPPPLCCISEDASTHPWLTMLHMLLAGFVWQLTPNREVVSQVRSEVTGSTWDLNLSSPFQSHLISVLNCISW